MKDIEKDKRQNIDKRNKGEERDKTRTAEEEKVGNSSIGDC